MPSHGGTGTTPQPRAHSVMVGGQVRAVAKLRRLFGALGYLHAVLCGTVMMLCVHSHDVIS